MVIDFTSKARRCMFNMSLERFIIEESINSMDFSKVGNGEVIIILDEMILKSIVCQYDKNTDAVDVLEIGSLENVFVRRNQKVFNYNGRNRVSFSSRNITLPTDDNV